jgi:nicotinamidase-related amidase
MAKSALLIQDVQNGIVSRITDPEDYLKKVATTIDTARKAGVKIIYVRVAFRPGHPEANPKNKMFGQLAKMGAFIDGDDSTTISDAVTPIDGDVVLIKRRVSSFTGTDLEVILRSLGISDIVLAGISTSGVILSTVRHASDYDYGITVLEDLCEDTDPEVHKVLMGKVFPRQCTVETSQEWLSKLG